MLNNDDLLLVESTHPNKSESAERVRKKNVAVPS
jgi:hypothetical protein